MRKDASAKRKRKTQNETQAQNASAKRINTWSYRFYIISHEVLKSKWYCSDISDMQLSNIFKLFTETEVTH
jgi:hypothetical protein